MSDGKGDEPEERKLGFYKIVSPLTSEPCGEWVSGIKKKVPGDRGRLLETKWMCEKNKRN